MEYNRGHDAEAKNPWIGRRTPQAPPDKGQLTQGASR